jgi:hypothetical protein
MEYILPIQKPELNELAENNGKDIDISDIFLYHKKTLKNHQ